MAGGEKLFNAALRRAIAQPGGAELVRQAADALLIAASSGVPWALNMLADRLDGKPGQSVTITKKNADEMSLDELRDHIAGLLSQSGSKDSGASESDSVH